MAVEIVVGICLMVAVGLVTESKGWTIAAMMVGNVGLNIIGYFVAHIPGIGDAMWSGKVYWSSAATIVLATEIALIAAMLGTAVFIQSRKTNFI